MYQHKYYLLFGLVLLICSFLPNLGLNVVKIIIKNVNGCSSFRGWGMCSCEFCSLRCKVKMLNRFLEVSACSCHPSLIVSGCTESHRSTQNRDLNP